MSRVAFFRHASLFVWIAYFVVPSDAGGLVGGIPLGPLEAIALLTNADATGPHERSGENRDPTFTRIDRRLDFATDGRELPLAFFNDTARFNFHDPQGPRRRQLAFAADWSGQWWANEGAHTLYLEAPESHSQLFIDGVPVASVTPTGGPTEVNLPLAVGWHRLDLTFSSPYGAPRRFSAGEVRNGVRRPFDAAGVVTQRLRDRGHGFCLALDAQADGHAGRR